MATRASSPRLAWTLLLLLLGKLHVVRGEEEDDEASDFTKNGGWALWFVLMLASFWALAVVVEEYFVPALSVLCDVLDLPDDVAGATFMAAGASSPEMFSAFVALFITHTSLGIGTIIGSEIFNHLCICAGSVLYAKSGFLQLDARILARDIIFYFLALAGLLYCESNAHKTTKGLDDDSGEDRIFLHWYQALVLMAGYGLYVIVCANYGKILKMVCPRKPQTDGYEPLESTPSPLMEQLTPEERESFSGKNLPDKHRQISTGYDVILNEPVINFRAASDVDALTPADASPLGINSIGSQGDVALAVSPEPATSTLRESSGSDLPTATATGGAVLRSRPSFVDVATKAATIVLPESVLKLTAPLDYTEATESSFGCYLWKKSRFYSKVRVSSRAWQLRWCVIDKKGFRSFRERGELKNIRSFDVYHATKVEIIDDERNIIKIFTPTGNLRFQAPTAPIVVEMVKRLQHTIDQYRTLSTEEQTNLWDRARLASTEADSQEAAKKHDHDEEEEHHEELIAWPSTASGMFLHVVLLPLKVMIYFTVPDVRQADSRNRYMLANMMCVIYLGLFSFTMSKSVEELAKFIGISEVVAGLTISAAGTSFPNILASMIVARQGLGNMSVGNAFGSNVFNVFVGLGLPWFLYCFFGDQDVNRDTNTYFGLSAGGVVFPTLVLGMLLVAFVVLLWFTKMRLFKWHAYLFIALYLSFLVWAFVWECKGPNIDMSG